MELKFIAAQNSPQNQYKKGENGKYETLFARHKQLKLHKFSMELKYFPFFKYAQKTVHD